MKDSADTFPFTRQMIEFTPSLSNKFLSGSQIVHKLVSLGWYEVQNFEQTTVV